MAKQFGIKRLVLLMSAAGIMGLHQNVMAAAFQLWEQDGASIGNYHAGVAAEAADASTAYYNPAGLVRIKNQQFVLGGDPVLTDFKYSGSINVNLLPAGVPPVSSVSNNSVTAQGGSFNFVPFGHYAAPLTENLVFGLSAVVPFGLKTNYGNTTDARYVATLTSVQVYDISPSLGFAINDKISIGAGFDAQRIKGEFDQFVVGPSGTGATESDNSGSGNSYGYHLGVLFQPSDKTRFGLSYHSQVVHHLRGHSLFSGPLANGADGGTQGTNQLRTSTTLPPISTVSLFHSFNPLWDVMASVSYIQWSVFKQLILKNVSGINDEGATNTLPIIINENYHNSWNYAVGANYHVNDAFMLRTGLGYDETPSNNSFRNLQLPDASRVAVALGGHYQATKTIAFDLGWTHLFVMNTHITNRSQRVGDEVNITNGSVQGSADVYGLQIKWDIV